jgi:hypothetical protein
MTITAEQFNKIALKEDVNRIEGKLDTLIDNMDGLVTSMDGQKKKLNNIEQDFISNQGAHDRIQTDVNEVRNHAGMKVKNPVL